ncbi:hypothetical protein E5288_WYG005809 [Bos mutus]|uniref:Uncharacterized protein n=1 Tax=Bos mutus TaxID=72004 RepID=A0A6B0QXC2_9CETA|nr:hypothetical protein [Bos mutus]
MTLLSSSPVDALTLAHEARLGAARDPQSDLLGHSLLPPPVTFEYQVNTILFPGISSPMQILGKLGPSEHSPRGSGFGTLSWPQDQS